MSIYLENRANVQRHNLLFDRGVVTFRMGMNEYSDLSHEEFQTQMYGLKRSLL